MSKAILFASRSRCVRPLLDSPCLALVTAALLTAGCEASDRGSADESDPGPGNVAPGDDDVADGDDDDDDDDDDNDDDDDDDDDDDGDDDDDDEDDDDDDDNDDDVPKFDIGDPEEGDPPEDEELELTYIWIANSPQGTVSKINTRTLVEEGRYITRPDALGNPSRTSVGLGGNVVVLNRAGGATKIFARPEDCSDKNGNGVIDTATDANFLPWDQEECVAWYTEFNYASQRGVAWTAEEIAGDEYEEKVWLTGAGGDAGLDIHVLLLNGETGVVEEQVAVPVQHAVVADPYGAYGGAVDSENNFWFSNLSAGWLVKVGYADLGVDVHQKPYNTYGFTVDGNKNVWVCGYLPGQTARFDPDTATWSVVNFAAGDNVDQGGCMADGEDRLWADGTGALGPTMFAIDINTLEVVKSVAVPANIHGVSIDFDGYVWAAAYSDPRAFRIDPETDIIDTFTGLTQPYTYSDMTGFALSNVQTDPEG